jgi:capsular exopolysaccharide synthesis family protein
MTAEVLSATDERAPWARFLRAHVALILTITVVATAGGWIALREQPRMYASEAVVVVFPAATGVSSSQQSVVMGTERWIASSSAVLSIASRSLGVSPHDLQSGLSVSVPADTDLLNISFSARDPRAAQAAAQAVARAYVRYRTPKPTPAPAGSKSAPTVPPGAVQPQIITDAPLPSAPASPNRWLGLAVALILGFALGVGVAMALDALDDRLRGVADLELQSRAPVLGSLPALRSRRRSAPVVMLSSPASTVAEAYRDLRTRLLQLAGRGGAHVVLLAGPDRENSTAVAANLSVALAQAGRQVVLVGADLRVRRPPGLFSIDDPGLSSVLAGDEPLKRALRDSDVDGLRVLAPGPAVTDRGALLQSEALSRLLGQLRAAADFVVVDAPPVLASADTGMLAEHCDLVVLVADARLSTRRRVRDATRQLERSSVPLIACVFDNVGRARRVPAVASALPRPRVAEPFRPSAKHTATDARQTVELPAVGDTVAN